MSYANRRPDIRRGGTSGTSGGEIGIRTRERFYNPYPLSRRALSSTQPSLRWTTELLHILIPGVGPDKEKWVSGFRWLPRTPLREERFHLRFNLERFSAVASRRLAHSIQLQNHQRGSMSNKKSAINLRTITYSSGAFRMEHERYRPEVGRSGDIWRIDQFWWVWRKYT
jgi:hypothetical protein